MASDPEELLASGDARGALAALKESVRGAPADPKLRIFLFQLLAVAGDWTRALQQLKVAAELDPSAETMARAYREAIVCEVFRERVFAGEKEPLIFGEPEDWIAWMVGALKALAGGDPEEAAALRERAFEAAPATPGRIDGAAFEWIADADTRLGPLLEVIVNGRYFWMPFGAVAELRLEPPSDLRDVVWTPGELTLRNGGGFVVMIPARYAGTTDGADDAALLGRSTTWTDAGSGTWVGRGQRLFATDAGEHPLLDIREIGMDGAAGVADG